MGKNAKLVIFASLFFFDGNIKKIKRKEGKKYRNDGRIQTQNLFWLGIEPVTNFCWSNNLRKFNLWPEYLKQLFDKTSFKVINLKSNQDRPRILI